MKNKAPVYIFALVILVLGASLFSDQGYGKRDRLEAALKQQREKNKTMRMHVNKLKSDVVRLKRDDAFVEKYVREHHGYAKENEIVYFFND